MGANVAIVRKSHRAVVSLSKRPLKTSRRVEGRRSPLRRKKKAASGSLGRQGSTAVNHEVISWHGPGVCPSGSLLAQIFQGRIPAEAQND